MFTKVIQDSREIVKLVRCRAHINRQRVNVKELNSVLGRNDYNTLHRIPVVDHHFPWLFIYTYKHIRLRTA